MKTGRPEGANLKILFRVSGEIREEWSQYSIFSEREGAIWMGFPLKKFFDHLFG
jgi:hypothetical protein